ncbi:galactose oxidase-like domain-containing protein [Noviherbaspirillum sedimenti]|nr:galactose oxidase-like domain-containing protein [Noviherbaspirillum sedimenti]
MHDHRQHQQRITTLMASLLLCTACGGGGSASNTSAAPGTAASATTAPTTSTTSDSVTTSTASTTSTTAPPAIPHTRSSWSDVISLPIVPVAAANLPNGKVLTWSAFAPDNFGDENAWGQTYSAIFDPASRTSQQRVVTETQHDMFCPGTTMLADGRILINGGSSSQKTTFYNPANDAWTTGPLMNIPRGYPGNTILADGSVLTLGGAWSGGASAKDAEIWSPSGWRVMSGIPIAPFIGPDPRGTYRGDNHLWLFAQANGRVFHAGPGANMHWIDTSANGQVVNAGTRGNDAYSMNGNAVLYDIGKLLKIGGAPAYEDADSNNAAYLIDMNNVSVRKIATMNYARAMHNSVVLPNGQVVITGGQTYVKLFSDDSSVLMAELWDPKTEIFSKLSAMQVPRNYHSFSLLLPDGRVLVGGGGLCGACTTNHANVEILTPPYLLMADGTAASRPAITSAPTTGSYGASITVTTNVTVNAFVLMRLSAVTHSINNDQRRVPLQSSSVDGRSHQLAIPANRGILPPGYYMLFAMNADGVPSIANTIQIR